MTEEHHQEKHKSTNKRKFLNFKILSFLIVTSFSSCSIGFISPTSSPKESTFFLDSIYNGMHLWDEEIKDIVTYKSRPEWCVYEKLFPDPEYEITCYQKLDGNSKEARYRKTYCMSESYSEMECSQKDVETFTHYVAGKWTRYFGDKELLPQEKAFGYFKGVTILVGLIIFWIFIPLFIFYLILNTVLSSFKRHSQSR
jgi:hypothetical protein